MKKCLFLLSLLCGVGGSPAMAADLSVPKGSTVNIATEETYDTIKMADGGGTYDAPILNINDGGKVTAATVIMSQNGYGNNTLNVNNGGELIVTTLNFTQSTGTAKVYAKSGGVMKIGTVNYTGNRTSELYADGGVLTVDQIIAQYQDQHRLQVKLQNNGTLNLGGASGATDFTLNAGTLNLSGAVTCHTLTVGVGLTFTVSDSLLSSLIGSGDPGSGVTLFTFNVATTDSLDNLKNAIEEGIASYDGSQYDLSNVTISVENPNNGDTPGSISISGWQVVPEPSTATLGLLGFSLLLSRRRRKV